ncbi:MAG: MFS transporter [SAR202 cluster bacterium]|nr:MFS transporter [SAR202 cluster bacterium]
MERLSAIVQARLQRYVAALQYRDYRTMWFATLWAGAAAWALIVARGWLVFEESGSSLWVGLATFAAMAPRLVVTPFVGFLADMMDRKTLLAWTYGINLVHNLVLGLLVATGTVEIWHIIVLSLVNGTARAAQMTTSQALMPNLVPRNHLLNAIALNSATQQGDRLVGPALIAPLLAFFGAGPALFLCSAFYGLGMVQILRVKTQSAGGVRQEQRFFDSLLKGAVVAYSHPIIVSLILLVAAHCAFTMAFESIIPSLSKSKLGAQGGAAFSYLMMMVGAGALVSNLWLAGILQEKTRGRLYFLMGVGSGISIMVMGISPNMPTAMLAAAAMGFTQGGFMSINQTMIQSIVPDNLRGRIAGVQQWHTGGTMAIFNLTNGVLVDVVGPGLLLGVTGALFLGVMAVSLLRGPLLQIYVRGIPDAAQDRA